MKWLIKLFNKYVDLMILHFDIVSWFSYLPEKEKLKIYNYYTTMDCDLEILAQNYKKEL